MDRLNMRQAAAIVISLVQCLLLVSLTTKAFTPTSKLFSSPTRAFSTFQSPGLFTEETSFHLRSNNKSIKKLIRNTLQASSVEDGEDSLSPSSYSTNNGEFDLTTALFCGGLAFDAYAEPPANSSRWEKGSSGCNVAFQSPSFTRSIYKALLQVKPIRCSDLPDEDDTAESLMTGSGVDAYLLVAVAEGKWKEDIAIIEKEKFNDGVLGLQGCAHVGRSSTAWSNVNENKAKAELKKGKGSGAYHVKSSWGKGGQAVWEADSPFYLYVQDPKEARLVFTVMDDDIVGDGSSIGSTSRRLSEIIPAAKVDDVVTFMKNEVMAKIKRGEEVDINDSDALMKSLAQEWDGSVKLTSMPKKEDKNGQIAAAAAAGALVAGPAGAAVGGIFASMYEGQVRGRVDVNVKYMPIPSISTKGETYKVKGGLPGVSWGDLYEKHIGDHEDVQSTDAPSPYLGGSDLEFCCFVTHDKTGCSCGIYRSLEKKLIAVSFRGTCELVDLVTDASISQETWVEGEDIESEGALKVHLGFRKSLQSISRKLKELVLASVAPGESISEYDLVVTGHSLGGSLSTLFTADIGEYGIDAGRGLPQLEESEPWWSSLASNFLKKGEKPKDATPPRPKSLKMYNFGSPRVGNKEFVAKFDSLVGNGIDEAYRIVNDQDVVARLPRTVNALGLVSIGYEHCGPTVLISIPKDDESGEPEPLVWIEGQSEGVCPVRDGTALTSPLAKGSLLGDIVSAVKADNEDTNSNDISVAADSNAEDFLEKGDMFSKLSNAVKGRMETFQASDLAGVVGIDKSFVERESKIIKSVFSGEALNHHMEDEYYLAMGRACGFIAAVGEEIKPIPALKSDTE